MWQSKAAAQGLARSQNALGAMLYNGTGGPRNDKEALYWFTRAAEQGHTEALPRALLPPGAQHSVT